MGKLCNHVLCPEKYQEVDCQECPDNFYNQNNKETLESLTRKPGKVRTFDSGATRDTDENKLDPEGFFSSIVIQRYCEYLKKHRIQSDGQLRASDNWQKGMPLSTYMKSMWRHFLDVWKEHRGFESREGIEDALMAVIFNAMGYAHEILKERNYGKRRIIHND